MSVPGLLLGMALEGWLGGFGVVLWIVILVGGFFVWARFDGE
jgi:type IV secretory pathway TrbD component